jgi:hypothetical protein
MKVVLSELIMAGLSLAVLHYGTSLDEAPIRLHLVFVVLINEDGHGLQDLSIRCVDDIIGRKLV